MFDLSLKSVCQVVEEGIVGLVSLEPGPGRPLLSSLCYSLGIPLLVLDSSSQPPPASALSSIINLSAASEMVGKALTDVIKAKSGMNSVMVYKTDNDFLLLKNLIHDLGPQFNGGFKLLELKNLSRLAERLSLGGALLIVTRGGGGGQIPTVTLRLLGHKCNVDKKHFILNPPIVPPPLPLPPLIRIP